MVRWGIGVAVVVVSAALAAQGTASISGRAVTSDTPAVPIRNAAITLTGVD
jgi:hypothetical protein